MEAKNQNQSIKNILYILAGLGGISLLIITHELGHFLFAKLFNVATPTFSIGFGPTLYEFLLGKTIFKISLFPFGGYVSMDPEQFKQQAYLPKMLIVFGGVLFNFIFAYSILIYYGLRGHLHSKPIIKKIIPDSPAEMAGLKPGDIIIACNDHIINTDSNEITRIIANSHGKTIQLTIDQNNDIKTILIPLNSEHPMLEKTGWLGIELEQQEKQSILSNISRGHKQFTTIAQDLRNVFSKITNQEHPSAIIGPIGIINLIGKILAIKPELYWLILSLLSMNIGILNLIPIPFFDGGKALLITIETIAGKSIPSTFLWIISTLFLALLMLLIMRVTMSDIKTLIRKK